MIRIDPVEALRAAVTTLESKAPEEVDAYCAFVLEVAESVAGAAEGGDQTEGAALEKIRTALGSGGGA